MSENTKSNSYVELACRYIAENYMHGIGVADISAYVAIDRTYLYRLFLREKGVSTSKYLQSFRLERAKELLSDGKIPLLDVHREVGFTYRSRFVKMFRKAYGLTPADYVKSKNE